MAVESVFLDTLFHWITLLNRERLAALLPAWDKLASRPGDGTVLLWGARPDVGSKFYPPRQRREEQG